MTPSVQPFAGRLFPHEIFSIMNLLIVVHHRFALWNAPAWFGERLSQEFPQLQILQRASYDGIEEDLREAEIIFTISLPSGTICRGQESALVTRALRGCPPIPIPGTGEQRRGGDEFTRR